MMAQITIAVFGLYLLSSIFFVRWIVRRSKQAGRNPRYWGAGAALFMYLLVFWDHVPVLVLHRYYCNKDAGFWVYKTPEQWINENPEVVGGSWSDQSKWRREPLSSMHSRVWISSRIYIDVQRQSHFAHTIDRVDERLVDMKTMEILAQSVNYWRGSTGQLAMGFNSWTSFKLWLGWGNRECEESSSNLAESNSYSDRFNWNRYLLSKLGEGK